MKRNLLSLLLLIAIGLSSFAADKGTNPAVMQSFEKHFGKPSSVITDEVNGMTRVSFTQDAKQFSAFFQNDGELIAVAKFITLSELPPIMQRKLENQLNGARVIETYQMESKGDISYVVVLETAKKVRTLRNDGTGWYQLMSKRK